MSVVTVVATVELDSTPPRVRLDVTDTGSPNLFATTVLRHDPDGVLRPVRTPDDGPLVLSTVGSDRVGVLYDYEAPYGAQVSYSTVESPTQVTAQLTIPVDRVWLIPPGLPSLSIPIELRIGSLDVESLPVAQGVFRPMGRRFPIVHTDGVRKAPESSMTVGTETLEELRALLDILADASTVLLNEPASMGLGIGARYIAVGEVQERRLSDIGTDERRDVVMPFVEVDRPAGGTSAARTYQDLLDGFATYGDLAAAYPTYYDVLVGT